MLRMAVYYYRLCRVFDPLRSPWRHCREVAHDSGQYDSPNVLTTYVGLSSLHGLRSSVTQDNRTDCIAVEECVFIGSLGNGAVRPGLLYS